MEKTERSRSEQLSGFLPLAHAPKTPSPISKQRSASIAPESRIQSGGTATEPVFRAGRGGSTNPPSNVITPPTTPGRFDVDFARKRSSVSKDSSTLISAPTEELKSMLSVAAGLGANPKQMVVSMIEKGMDVGPLPSVPEVPRPYLKSYQINDEELGHGAWSIVYSATEIEQASPRAGSVVAGMMPPSPPATPEGPSRRASQSQVLAVKVLSRRDGRQILEKEARILSYLHSHPRSPDYLVPFHGFDERNCSIILSAVPLSLEKHAKQAGKTRTSTATMYDPVIGAVEWANLATSLLDGLAFLQGKGCVHGDIKPANILLRPDSNTRPGMTPLYCDFSSSHILPPAEPAAAAGSDAQEIEEVNAVTTEYAAPELLHALQHRGNGDGAKRAVATFASDVYALGVTLLFAATGENAYGIARLDLQKAAMAREGKPLAFARCGPQSSRVIKGRAVDEALAGAVEKDVRDRMDVADWGFALKAIFAKWREQDWRDGGRI